MRRLLIAATGVAAAIDVAALATRPAPGMESAAVDAAQIASVPLTLAVPGRANAHVSLAAVERHVVAAWAAWLPDGTTDVYAAASRDGGATFAAPVRVNSTPGDARVNGEQPPRVAFSPRVGDARALPDIVVVWTAKGAGANGTALLMSRSVDGGRTYSRSTTVRDTAAPGNRGWQAVHADSSGDVFVAWLDHRRVTEPSERIGAPHQHGAASGASGPRPDGVAMAQLSDLFVRQVGVGPSARPVTSGVCYCCKTALASGSAGEVFVAWRHVYAGNLRDIAFATSRDRARTFTPPIRVSEDGWQLEGCPDDGPAMAVGIDGRIHVVWPTVVTVDGEPTKALFLATSADGRSFTPRRRVPTLRQANHPVVAVREDGALAIAWDESGEGERHVVYAVERRSSPGAFSIDRAVVSRGTSAVYPTVVAASGGVVIGWTSGPPDRSVVQILSQ